MKKITSLLTDPLLDGALHPKLVFISLYLRLYVLHKLSLYKKKMLHKQKKQNVDQYFNQNVDRRML